MNPDLERLIRLQALDLELQSLRRIIETEAERRQGLQVQIETHTAAVTGIRERLAASQNARRAIEKDLAQVQTRLGRYKDQLMEVKTNKEYHAMQTEIAAAEAEVRKFEDRILENMVEADDMSAELKKGEQELTRVETNVKVAIQGLTVETAAAQQRLTTASAARAEAAKALPRATLDLFENIARNRGTAVVEARDGHCSVCHVRLRPKVYQDVRRNESILQCDSCHRILYYIPPVERNAPSVAN
jgi:predicted  nucleic acid-binding Zn-ribbon protein